MDKESPSVLRIDGKTSIFISYSHKDEEWKDRLATHLRVFEQEGILETWDDRRISGGDDWFPEIQEAMNRATVAVLLISADYLTSDFILKEEVPIILQQRKQSGLIVLPVIIRPCAWKEVSWLQSINARPKDGRPISSGNENQQDQDMADITAQIGYLLKRRSQEVRDREKQSPETQASLAKLESEIKNAKKRYASIPVSIRDQYDSYLFGEPSDDMQNRTNTSSSPYNFYPKNLVEEIDQLTVKRHEIEKRGSKVELSLQEEIRRVVRSLHDVRPPHMGDTVAGAELIDIIGSGNFGDVWEAKDNASGQKVAVKIFHANKMGLGQNLHYFRRGVEAMDKLTHCKGRPESVIELLYVDPSRLAFSMPLVPRTDLSKTIKSWSVEKKIVFFKTLCDAVKFAHANQILHRDVKPENILVTEDLRPVLTDFDICDLLYKKTLSTQATGTVVYASPEQLMGTNERSFSSDVYSLGRILHFLLLEKHPDLLHEKLPRLDDLQGKPECLVRIIRRCTQFEPERRYQTVDELLVDIKKCEVNLETAEVGIPSVADSAKPPRNWFKDATIVAAIIGAITLVITTAMPLIFNDSKKQTDKPSMTLVQQPSKPQADTTINTTAKSPELKSEIQIAPNTIDPKETTASRGGYVLVGIPGGKFPMGINSENVPHPVQIKPFYLGKYEVTVEEYGLFLKANPDDSKNKPDDWDDQIRNPKLPVTKVSWNDAQAYCKWAGLRLPSEAEWEWTARAGTATRFWSGDKDADLKRAGWYNGNSDGRLHTVGEKEPNPFGLFDMHGNIWEWVEDDWHYDYSGAPTDGSAWVNKQWAVFRVARGGSFGFDAVNCRSATRNRVVPGLRNDNLGFRPARSIP